MHSSRSLVAPKKACSSEHLVSTWATHLPSLYHNCASFGRPIASIQRSLWRPLCLHRATTTTLEPPWQWFCLHSASFARPAVPLQQLMSFKEGTGVVLQQLHRNRTFWVWATTERLNHFSGRSKMARGSQPCVKGHYRETTRRMWMPNWWHVWLQNTHLVLLKSCVIIMLENLWMCLKYQLQSDHSTICTLLNFIPECFIYLWYQAANCPSYWVKVPIMINDRMYFKSDHVILNVRVLKINHLCFSLTM